ncbi:MAG: hypothetical protein IT307_14865 [Chloroflexi bacterium]|nr:hypothetical protein [Chloroflexota bacterium]
MKNDDSEKRRRRGRYALYLSLVATIACAARWYGATTSDPGLATDSAALAAGVAAGVTALTAGAIGRETIHSAAGLLAAALAALLVSLVSGPAGPRDAPLVSDISSAVVALIGLAIWLLARPPGATHRGRILILLISATMVLPLMLFFGVSGPGGQDIAVGVARAPAAVLLAYAASYLARRFTRRAHLPVHAVLGWLTAGTLVVLVAALAAR